MAGLDGGAHVSRNEGGDATSQRGARYGRVLFVVYLLLYGGYVGITAFAPSVMKRTPLAGINLSVLYGLGLIGAAFAMALAYDWLCRPLSKLRDDADADRDRQAGERR